MINLNWNSFFTELAYKLLEYKENRHELVEIVERICAEMEFKIPMLKLDEEVGGIDPFSVFGLFTYMKNSHTTEDRKKIMTLVKHSFALKTAIPNIVDIDNPFVMDIVYSHTLSLPRYPKSALLRGIFYSGVGEQAKEDIEILWRLFETALRYAKLPSAENRESLAEWLEKAIAIEGIGNAKIGMELGAYSKRIDDERPSDYGVVKAVITMGLFWIASDTFFPLNPLVKNYIKYLYEKDLLPYSVAKEVLSYKRNERLIAAEYLNIVEKFHAFIKSDQRVFKNFRELHYKAWLYQPYTKKSFLKDVYMEENIYDSMVSLLKNKKNIILQGAPGVGKTYAAKLLAYSILGLKDKERIMMVQFHQSYSYEDFVMGYRPTASGFKLHTGAFYDFCKKAAKDRTSPYFLIIDEINRGNLSKIFGELFMLIEADKRGEENGIQLVYSAEKFFVPENLYIIGTMNTADRSLAMLDYALRRRFAFIDIKAGFDTEGFKEYGRNLNNEKFNRLVECVKDLNSDIAEDDSLGEGFCIGHSYFCNLAADSLDEWKLDDIVEFELLPLLKEYWFDEPDKIKEWSDKLRGAVK
jgi:5-methylcytosine-specific restriction protein B